MSTSIDTRRDLIKACQLGDRRAQQRLYGDYCDAMYNVCYRIMGSHADAQDALQCAFVKVFRKLNQYNHESTPGAWIKRIVINECINQIRARKEKVVELKDYDTPDDLTDNTVIEDDLLSAAAVRAAIDDLPDGYRRVVSLYLIEGYDHTEIAEILDITVSTSKTQYHRAKKKLREALQKMNKAS